MRADPTPARRVRLAHAVLFIGLFVIGAAVRGIDLWRPVDGRLRETWREADEAAIARNFDREGMNILHPRIDWRGDGPGFAEMEFPLYPWAIAASYKIVGVHEVAGRIIAYLLAVGTLVVFAALARHMLPWPGAAAATLFFALSPLVVRISNALQPEALMLFAYVTAVYAFICWTETQAWRWYLVALATTALTLLAKLTAAHIGLLFAALLWQQGRWSALRDWRVWVFAVVSFAPSVAWYTHAHHLWLAYGNSLGVSNEDHWIGTDVFRNARFALGLAKAEGWYVWTPAGVFVAAVGVAPVSVGAVGTGGIAAERRAWAIRVALLWLASAFILYVAAIRTTAAPWALYYHVFSVPPVALLFGIGAERLWRLAWRWDERRTTVALTAAHTARSHSTGFQKLAWWAAAVSVPLTIATLGWHVARDIHPTAAVGDFAAAQAFRPLIPQGTLILSTGGPCTTAWARHAAYNASTMFYWLDRKGFNVCVERQSVSAALSFARRGARYYVAHTADLERSPRDAREIRRAFPLVRASNGWELFDLSPAGNAG